MSEPSPAFMFWEPPEEHLIGGVYNVANSDEQLTINMLPTFKERLLGSRQRDELVFPNTEIIVPNSVIAEADDPKLWNDLRLVRDIGGIDRCHDDDLGRVHVHVVNPRELVLQSLTFLHSAESQATFLDRALPSLKTMDTTLELRDSLLGKTGGEDITYLPEQSRLYRETSNQLIYDAAGVAIASMSVYQDDLVDYYKQTLMGSEEAGPHDAIWFDILSNTLHGGTQNGVDLPRRASYRELLQANWALDKPEPYAYLPMGTAR